MRSIFLGSVVAGAAALALFCGACGSSSTDSAAPSDGSDTTSGGPPSTTAPTGSIPCAVDEILADDCRSCHSSSPQFGASMPLVTLADLHAPAKSDPSKKVYELIPARITNDASPMPPPPNARLSDADRQTLTSWVSGGAQPSNDTCGSTTPTTPFDPSVNCTPDLSIGPGSAWSLPSTAGEDYVCYGVELKKDVATHVTGFVPRIDNKTVVHHVVLFQADDAYPTTPQHCNSGGSLEWRMVMAWAPGGKGLELPPEAGFPIKPEGTHWIVQMHYSNAQGLPDQKDSSGFDLCTSPPRQYEADILAFGTQDFTIPAGAANWSKECSITVPSQLAGTHLVAAMPHMHKLGVGMSTIRTPADASGPVDLGTVNNWSFDSQAWLSATTTLAANDKITTTCTWTNTTGGPVDFGEKTTEEMCYSFTLYYPKVPDIGGLGIWSWAAPAALSKCK